MRHAQRALVGVLYFGLATACVQTPGWPDTTSDGGEDGGCSDAGVVDGGTASDGGAPADGGTTPGELERLEATSSGGFGASRCHNDAGAFTLAYTVDFQRGGLDFSRCLPGGTTQVGSVALDAAALGELRDALRSLQPTTRSTCGADKPAQVVWLTASGTTQHYEDAFYACHQAPGAVYVDGLDAVFDLLARLAG